MFNERIKKLTKIFFITFLVFLCVITSSASLTAYADGAGTQDFEFQETEENLYAYRHLDDVTVIRFYEYGYGDADAYELCFYVYNPKGNEFSVDSRNNVQLGYCSRATDVFRTSYDKYQIVKDGQSETGLFMRFKINGFAMPDDADRFYCFSGVELVIDGHQNATEYPVSTVYRCTTAEGKTTITTDTLPTCNVDVTHTFYRSDYSDKGKFWSNQLSSCYFSLPKNFSASGDYGALEAVTAEFYNYYTKPVLIVKDEETYKKFKSYLGVNIEGNSSAGVRFWAGHLGSTGGIVTKGVYQLVYDNTSTQSNALREYKEYINTLNWLFYDDTDPDFSSEDYRFSGENLRTYFNEYATKYGRDKAVADLFESQTYYTEKALNLSGFDYGYNKHTYSIAEQTGLDDDVFGFGLKKDNANWLQSFFGISSSETKQLLPLVKVSATDLSLSNDDFSEKYYIDKYAVTDLKAFVAREAVSGKDVWLFRYDSCEYFGASSYVSDYANKGFAARQSVYLDFDILSFRFNQDNVKYTVAANGSPSDVWNNISGENAPLTWWEKFVEWLGDVFSKIGAWGAAILGGIVGIIAVVLIFKILKAVWEINNVVIKLVLSLAIIAGAVWLMYTYVGWLISIISGLGGLW